MVVFIYGRGHLMFFMGKPPTFFVARGRILYAANTLACTLISSDY